MALNINGTTGISGVDGSASAPALQGSDSNTGVSFGSDTVNINTGGSTRATVDSSGRLLVGTTTEGESAADELTISNSGNMGLTLRSTDSNYCNIYFSDATSGAGEYAGYVSYLHSSDSLHFATASTERMRLLSSGSLCIGVDTTNNSEKMRIDSTGSAGTVFLRHASTDDVPILVMRHTRNQGGSAASYIKFLDSNGTTRGFIDATTSGTTYSTSSDYRLKENITAISDGITRLKTLKPSKFNFIGDSKIVDGFLAHEVTAVPEAVTGTKDEVDSDNNPVYQGIDQSKLVPLLTAALQEAIAKIEVLETKVAALEAG